jgi:cysteine desulfurase/selenocysteine lyase
MQTGDRIYLNNAATSYPKPERVINAVKECIYSVPFHSLRAEYDMTEGDVVSSCREKLAGFFNVDNPRDIFFTSGSTESLNLALNGLDLNRGHVVTTAIEHNSVYRPLKRLESRGVIELTIVDCDINGYVEPESIGSAVRSNTRAVVVNHCSNVIGTVLDLRAISRIAHESGALLVVDASQSAGAIAIDVKDLDIDILAFTGHKSLYGLPGIGGIYVRGGIGLEPLKVGGTGVKSDLLYQPEERPLYYESGTQNIPGIVSLDAGLSFILEEGIDKIRKRKEMLFGEILRYLRDKRDIILYGSRELEGREAIVSFNIDGSSPQEIGSILENSFDIIVRSGLHCAPVIHRSLGSFPLGSIRVSPSYFTEIEEVEIFMDAMNQICRSL